VNRKHDRPLPMACVGAGTGLGECYLTGRPDGNYDVWPTEGGHTDFSPRDDEQVELLQFLKQRFEQPNRVSVERVVSGCVLLPNQLNDIAE
jgi:glucokinase